MNSVQDIFLNSVDDYDCTVIHRLNLLRPRFLCFEKRYLTRINVLKFKEIISSKTQSKLRKLCQLIRNINSSLLSPG